MKKILLVSGLALSTIAFGQATFNKMSVDFGIGLNKSMSSRGAGLATNLNLPHVELGVRHMLNNKYGLKFDLGYDMYKAHKDLSAAEDFTTHYIRMNFQGILNFTNVLDFNQFYDKLGVYGHAGPGIAFHNDGSNAPAYKMDFMANFIAGITAQYKISPKLALTGDISAIAHILQNVTLDGRSKLPPSNGFDVLTANASLGLNIYLGDAAEHADWTPTNYGDAEAMAALKAKIEKAEKDMMDDDKDGVPNYLDQEPGTAGGATVDTKGKTVKVEKIVDIDGDGVLDVNDFCPTIKGTASANGCPDRDGDGIYDFVDKCPNAAGLAADGGCPVVTQKAKETMTKAMQGVQFDNGKATLIKKSLPILDEVAKVMLANPSYNLSINGHTDNVGDPAKNLQLSEDRAKAVKAYLMGKGVAENRLSAKGYGDTQPKASNATAKGKAANRRVEFLVSFEQ
ncbi:MAG: OmpA/MotB domain protein [Crocinitomicaceae bacterium]|jgi:OOP family OmpA-OmpF porin|nr:OmpA/MotB domain protein [Crocinitomicaceae bacterium]